MQTIFFISSVFPLPIKSGASQRTFLLLQALQVQRHVVFIHVQGNNKIALPMKKFALAFPSVKLESCETFVELEAGSAITQVKKKLEHYFLLKKDKMLANKIQVLQQKYSCNQFFFRYPVHYLETRTFLQNVEKVYVDMDDDLAEKIASNAKFNTKFTTSIFYQALASYYKKLTKSILKDKKVKLLYANHPHWLKKWNNVVQLSNIPFPAMFRSNDAIVEPLQAASDEATMPNILFVGQLDYIANEKSLRFFLENIWHAFKQEPVSKGIQLNIVGAKCTSSNKEYWSSFKDVAVIGEVERLGLYYDACMFAISPIAFGSGSNIKVLEAFQYSKPIVVSSFSAKSFEAIFTSFPISLIANNKTEWLKVFEQLIVDDKLRKEIGETGNQKIQLTYSYQNFEKKVTAILAA